MKPRTAADASLPTRPRATRPGPEDIFVFGITPAGEVPLIASPEGIRLPGCSAGPAALRDVQERLREETGCEAAEFVPMTIRAPAAQGASGPTILLAPRLSRVGPGTRGLELVPLPDLPAWLNSRRAAGAVVDPAISVGVMMAERHHPRWALARLQEALRHLLAARPHAAAAG